MKGVFLITNYIAMGIVITNQCTAKCDHCCHSCSPNVGKQVEPDVVISCIKGSANIEQIKQIGFTGGEPFLVFDELLQYIKEASKYGKTSTVVTNCQWAYSYSFAYTRFKLLKEAGLIGLGISFDEFHEPYIKKENISNVLRAAKDIGFAIKLQTAILVDSSISNLFNELLSDLIDVDITFFACQPVGRAKEKIDKNRYIKDRDSRGGFCRKGGTFSVSYDGTVWPCCVPYVMNTQLSMGNIYQMSIENIFKNIENNAYLKILRNKGFDYFIDIARRHLNIEIPDKVSSPCELCALFFSDKNYYKFLPYI